MKTKAKKFSRKLLALFLAVLMALTCFTGVISAYGASIQNYHDDNVEYNDLAWDVLSDEQLATALLDYADEMLADFGPQIDKLLKGAMPTSGMYYYNAGARTFNINVAGLITAEAKIYTHSVDEIMETLESVASVISKYSGLIGDAGNLQLGSTKGMRRSNTSSCNIIRGVLGLLQKNSADYNGKDILGEFLRGGFDLGTVGNLAKLDIYGLIGNALGADAGYQSDLVYNLVQSIIFNNTLWFTDEEEANFKNGTTPFLYDEVLMKVLTDELLNKISVLVTYPDGTSSASRKEAIDAKMAKGLTYEEAATALGYDPNLKYSEEEQFKNNVLLFQYGSEKISLTTSDNLFGFAYRALKLAWNTVLKDTVKLVHVNYNAERGHGSNFDNEYYYWASKNLEGGWDRTNPTAMYSTANVNAWAEAVYVDYGAESADEFLGWVRHNFEFDRTVAEGATGIWSDIDETTLFNKLRYSPLADYTFNMQTGPVNLYFMQLGTDNLDSFFANDYANYSSLVAGLNDCLVAAVKDIFVGRDNIYKDTVGDSPLPTMAKVNPSGVTAADIQSITETLVSNALKIVQYTADTTDKNILNGFYLGGGTTLSEANLEAAMMPMLIACIGQVNLGSGKLERLIHPSDWDGCKDAEAVAFVALREYLSYVLPHKDYNSLVSVAADGTITATLEGTILPMARDAVAYVMEALVPVSGTDGTEWKAEDRPVNDPNTIFNLLNSVMCYYADDYDMAKSDDRAMGVASLLGVCDANGNSLIKTSNELWVNINLVANELFPVLGVLQGNGSGKFDSKDLIWNDIVLGFLEISDTSIHKSGMCGVSNFINRFLSIISAEPISSTPVVTTVYNLLKDLFNGLFGPRYTGQEFIPIPDATSTHPFDDLVHVGVLAGTTGTNVGVIQKLICNFSEFSGFGTSGVGTYPDSILRGLLFAVQAVNSFIPDAVNNIGDHQLKMASAEFENDTITGCTSGGQYDGNVVVTNNSIGVNNAYVDGMANTVNQLPRYYMNVTGAEISGTNASASVSLPASTRIAPGESINLAATTYYSPSGTDLSSSYSVIVTYDILDATGTTLYTGLKTRAYQYLTGQVGWADVVYPADRNGQLAEALETNNPNASMSLNGYNTYTTGGFGKGSYLNCLYPEYVVLQTSNLGAVNGYMIRFRNTSGTFGSNRSVDGLYYYDSKTVYDDNTGANVTVNMNNAIPIWDKETGDLLRKEMYDVSYDNGVNWDRGTNNVGYTEQEASDLYNNATPEQQAGFTRRDHVAYTLTEAVSAGIIQAYHKNDAGVYEYVYMKTGSGTNYDTTLSKVSMRGPCDGFYINFTKVTVAKNSSSYSAFCKYDGSTPVKAGSYPINMCAYNGNSSAAVNFTLVIGDDASADALNTNYNKLKDILTNYRESDFTNAQMYDIAGDALLGSLATQASVLTPTTALELSDKTVLSAITNTVATEYGDKAYKPYTTTDNGATTSPAGMPIGVKAEAYLGGSTVNGVTYGGVAGVYYFDANCTMPIYSNVELTANDVSAKGTDPAGMAVIEGTGDDAGKFWLRNAPAYETEWDTTTYDAPWQKNTEVQATDNKGSLLYKQVQYVYRDSASQKVNSTDPNWKAKFPVTEYLIIENDGVSNDNRGKYTKANDTLRYVIELVQGAINTSIAQPLFDNISIVRNNMNSTNFDVVTYNKMVSIAKKAEQRYNVVITYDYEENVIDKATGEPVKDEFGKNVTQTVTKTDTVPFSQYNGYKNNKNITITNVATESTLSSVQVEEYQRLFNFYMGKVVERGYLGDQLEAEILCASGNAYTALNATPATYNEDGTVATEAVVTKGTGAADAKFGAWAPDGTLVNEGATVYSRASWTAYVRALAKAVEIATTANTTYAYKNQNYYVASAKNDYIGQVTECYTYDSDLQKAEIALTPAETATVTVGDFTGGTITIDGAAYTAPLAYEVGETISVDLTVGEGNEFQYLLINGEKVFVTQFPYNIYLDKDVTIVPVIKSTGVTVSGKITIATNIDGSAGTIGIAGVDIYAGGTLVGTSADAGAFSVEIPAGTTELVIKGASTIPRTVTLSGTASVANAIIPIVICDYNNDSVINVADLGVFGVAYSGDYNAFADFNGDKTVNVADLGSFGVFYNQTVAYSALALD